MKVCHVVGARPNFMKAAPVFHALKRARASQKIIHSGQHYDKKMSEIFFQQLGIPKPNINLEVGSSSHGKQTGEVMIRLEPVLEPGKPDWVLVYGDINSTAAAAMVCVKLGIKVAHVEAGLRSNDRGMPEEHNRIVTDHLADLLFTPSSDGDINLKAEGIPAKRIKRVGNVMIDTLVRLLPQAKKLNPLGIKNDCAPFVLATLHRPSNVDDPSSLRALIKTLDKIAMKAPVYLPVHPRTRARLKGREPKRVHLVDPLGYLEFLALQTRAALVITDSGGIQEETTYLRTPCLTVRPNTERPITITLGTNELIGTNPKALEKRALRILSHGGKSGKIPPLWDGHAGERIAKELSLRTK